MYDCEMKGQVKHTRVVKPACMTVRQKANNEYVYQKTVELGGRKGKL